jgi:hypothetical protein
MNQMKYNNRCMSRRCANTISGLGVVLLFVLAGCGEEKDNSILLTTSFALQASGGAIGSQATITPEASQDTYFTFAPVGSTDCDLMPKVAVVPKVACFPKGEKVTITVAKLPGSYQFVRWVGDCEGTATSVTVDVSGTDTTPRGFDCNVLVQ